MWWSSASSAMLSYPLVLYDWIIVRPIGWVHAVLQGLLHSILVGCFVVAVLHRSGILRRLLLYLAEQKLSQILNGAPVTMAHLEVDIWSGRVYITDLIVHSPQRADWDWDAPLIGRCGMLRVHWNVLSILHTLFSSQRQVLWGIRLPPCIDVYSAELSDIQVFVEKRQHVFNFHLLDESLDIPLPSSFVSNNNMSPPTAARTRQGEASASRSPPQPRRRSKQRTPPVLLDQADENPTVAAAAAANDNADNDDNNDDDEEEGVIVAVHNDDDDDDQRTMSTMTVNSSTVPPVAGGQVVDDSPRVQKTQSRPKTTATTRPSCIHLQALDLETSSSSPPRSHYASPISTNTPPPCSSPRRLQQLGRHEGTMEEGEDDDDDFLSANDMARTSPLAAPYPPNGHQTQSASSFFSFSSPETTTTPRAISSHGRGPFSRNGSLYSMASTALVNNQQQRQDDHDEEQVVAESKANELVTQMLGAVSTLANAQEGRDLQLALKNQKDGFLSQLKQFQATMTGAAAAATPPANTTTTTPWRWASTPLHVNTASRRRVQDDSKQGGNFTTTTTTATTPIAAGSGGGATITTTSATATTTNNNTTPTTTVELMAKESLRVMKQVGKVVEQNVSDIRQQVDSFQKPPPRKAHWVDVHATDRFRVGRMILSDMRIFTKDLLTLKKSTPPSAQKEAPSPLPNAQGWSRPMYIREVAISAAELCPAMSLREDSSLPALGLPADKVLDVIVKRLLAEMAKSGNTTRLFQATLGDVLGGWTTTSSSSSQQYGEPTAATTPTMGPSR